MTIPKAHTVTAVILAGGKGSRFQGNDKGLVLFQNRPIIEHILERISPLVSHLLINANRNQEIYANYGYPVINDDLSDFQGPLAGVSVAMSQAVTSHILTLPCDGPFVTETYVNRMMQVLEKRQGKLAVAHDGVRRQPIHALIPVSLRDNLDEFLQAGGRGVGRWYGEHSIIQVDFSDSLELFQNINTAEQLIVFEGVERRIKEN